MERRESENGVIFRVVIKLRSDATPLPDWDASFVCAQEHNYNKPLRVYAATDHVFWGPREGMQVLANTFEGIREYFQRARRAALTRPVAVGPMLRSMLASLPEGFVTTSQGYCLLPDRETGGCKRWNCYNKLLQVKSLAPKSAYFGCCAC